MIEFTKRTTIRRTEVANLRRWQSCCGRFAVIEIKSLLGLTRRYLAIERRTAGEAIIGRHRTKNGAERRCREHLKGA